MSMLGTSPIFHIVLQKPLHFSPTLLHHTLLLAYYSFTSKHPLNSSTIYYLPTAFIVIYEEKLDIDSCKIHIQRGSKGGSKVDISTFRVASIYSP